MICLKILPRLDFSRIRFLQLTLTVTRLSFSLLEKKRKEERENEGLNYKLKLIYIERIDLKCSNFPLALSACIQWTFAHVAYPECSHTRVNLYGAFEKGRGERVFLLRTQQPRLFRTRAVTEHDLRVENRAASEKLLVVRTSANMWLTQSSRVRIRAGMKARVRAAFSSTCVIAPFSFLSPRDSWSVTALSFSRNNSCRLCHCAPDRNRTSERVFTVTSEQDWSSASSKITERSLWTTIWKSFVSELFMFRVDV